MSLTNCINYNAIREAVNEKKQTRSQHWKILQGERKKKRKRAEFLLQLFFLFEHSFLICAQEKKQMKCILLLAAHRDKTPSKGLIDRTLGCITMGRRELQLEREREKLQLTPSHESAYLCSIYIVLVVAHNTFCSAANELFY